MFGTSLLLALATVPWGSIESNDRDKGSCTYGHLIYDSLLKPTTYTRISFHGAVSLTTNIEFNSWNCTKQWGNTASLKKLALTFSLVELLKNRPWGGEGENALAPCWHSEMWTNSLLLVAASCFLFSFGYLASLFFSFGF